MDSLVSRLWWGVRWGGGAHKHIDSTEDENNDQEDDEDELSMTKGDSKYQKISTKDDRQVKCRRIYATKSFDLSNVSLQNFLTFIIFP